MYLPLKGRSKFTGGVAAKQSYLTLIEVLDRGWDRRSRINLESISAQNDPILRKLAQSRGRDFAGFFLDWSANVLACSRAHV